MDFKKAIRAIYQTKRCGPIHRAICLSTARYEEMRF